MSERERRRRHRDQLFYTRYAAVQARLRAELLRTEAHRLMAQIYANLALAKRLAEKPCDALHGR